jgi:hypothetical protein
MRGWVVQAATHRKRRKAGKLCFLATRSEEGSCHLLLPTPFSSSVQQHSVEGYLDEESRRRKVERIRKSGRERVNVRASSHLIFCFSLRHQQKRGQFDLDIQHNPQHQSLYAHELDRKI